MAILVKILHEACSVSGKTLVGNPPSALMGTARIRLTPPQACSIARAIHPRPRRSMVLYLIYWRC